MENVIPDFIALKKIDNQFVDESRKLIQQWHEYYSKKFLESDVATSLSKIQRDELPFVLGLFCDFCYSYHFQKPGQWTALIVKDVCTNLMPGMIMASDAFFLAIVPVLCLFFDWMSLENYLPDTKLLKETLLSLEPKMLKNAQDPYRWSINKLMLLGIAAKGYDMQNLNAIKAAFAHENKGDLIASADMTMTNPIRLPKQEAQIKTREDIIDDLCYLTLGFPKAAVQAAIEQGKKIIPLLLNLLNEVIEDCQSINSNYMGHLFSMFLLAQFREKAAFPLMIKLLSLPGAMPEILLGDSITEKLHRMVGSVYNGDLTAIQNLIENPTLYVWSRNVGIKSLLVLVKNETLQRDWVINYFKGLFSHPAFVDDEMAMAHLVNASCVLYPAELYNEIKIAFDRNSVDIDYIDMKQVDSALAMDQVNALKEHLNEHYDFIYDTIKEMQGWRCFQNQKIEEQGNASEFYQPEGILLN